MLVHGSQMETHRGKPVPLGWGSMPRGGPSIEQGLWLLSKSTPLTGSMRCGAPMKRGTTRLHIWRTRLWRRPDDGDCRYMMACPLPQQFHSQTFCSYNVGSSPDGPGLH